MPKYSCELDSDTVEHKFYIDGQEVPADSFNISYYTYNSPEAGDSTRCYYVSVGVPGGDNQQHSLSESWDSKTGQTSTSLTTTTIAKDVIELVKKTVARLKLFDSLSKLSIKK